MTLLNCTGYRNGAENFKISAFIRVGETITVKNCAELGGGVSLASFAIQQTNSWMNPPFAIPSSEADFISLDTIGIRGARKPDGSLPDINFMHLDPGSQFINAGTNVGLPYYGSAPDLGAFETTDSLTYTLTVDIMNGSVIRIPNRTIYNSGMNVVLTATPATGYHFLNWSGDVRTGHETDNPLTVTMDANKMITANFVINTYTLTINTTNGTVVKDPDQATYDSAVTVELTAMPAIGYIFTNWTGDVPPGRKTDNPLTITMDMDRTITANLALFMSTDIQTNAGWNLVSVPYVQLNDSTYKVFPGKTGSMFKYNTATRDYQPVSTLVNGAGYWVNYLDPTTVTVTGFAPGPLTVTVDKAGWVLVGSSEVQIQVSSLVFSDGAMRLGSVFRYDAAAKIYKSMTVINPGEAVWLNVSNVCTVTLP